MSHWLDPNKRIRFIAASNENESTIHDLPSTSRQSTLTGEEIREFYESLWQNNNEKKYPLVKLGNSLTILSIQIFYLYILEEIEESAPIKSAAKVEGQKKKFKKKEEPLTERDSLYFLRCASEGGYFLFNYHSEFFRQFTRC